MASTRNISVEAARRNPCRIARRPELARRLHLRGATRSGGKRCCPGRSRSRRAARIAGSSGRCAMPAACRSMAEEAAWCAPGHLMPINGGSSAATDTFRTTFRRTDHVSAHPGPDRRQPDFRPGAGRGVALARMTGGSIRLLHVLDELVFSTGFETGATYPATSCRRCGRTASESSPRGPTRRRRLGLGRGSGASSASRVAPATSSSSRRPWAGRSHRPRHARPTRRHAPDARQRRRAGPTLGVGAGAAGAVGGRMGSQRRGSATRRPRGCVAKAARREPRRLPPERSNGAHSSATALTPGVRTTSAPRPDRRATPRARRAEASPSRASWAPFACSIVHHFGRMVAMSASSPSPSIARLERGRPPIVDPGRSAGQRLGRLPRHLVSRLAAVASPTRSRGSPASAAAI